MQALVTPSEMGEIDAAAPEPVDMLIGRAGAAVARAALRRLGGAYGRRVVVVAGKGNNGADGRDAARRLGHRGVRVDMIDAANSPAVLPGCDLVIDAAYGTGFRGTYEPPSLPANQPEVLAVDIPSGVSGLTGEASGRPWPAAETITFAAWKPGLLLADGPALSGDVTVADIGLDVSSARAHVIGANDVAGWLPRRPANSHKWKAAVWLVAGSPSMTGAAHLAARAAFRTGAGYVRLSSPGVDDDPGRPTESVGWTLPGEGWAGEVIEGLDRFGALVVGPGLGRDRATIEAVREVVARSTLPTLVDGDGLTALADGPGVSTVLADRSADAPPVVLTPHDGEYKRVTGHPPQADRLEAARELAASTGAVVLLKGSTTIVSAPDGRVLVSTTGDSRLATAGTGDVLSGVIGALLAQRVSPLEAAATGAWLHGRAAHHGPASGLVASDLPDLLPIARRDAEVGEAAGTSA